MNFVDKTVVELGDPSARPGVFSESALEAIVGVAYDAESLSVEGPFSPVFDEFRLVFPVSARGTIEGAWQATGTTARTDALLRISGAFAGESLRVDALWRGAIAARSLATINRIESVRGGIVSLRGIDDEIVALLGALPAGSVLESERRARVLARLRAGADQPGAITEDVLDRWLVGTGARTVSDLLTRAAGTGHGGVLELTYSPPAGGLATPRAFPVVVALLVRDAGVSIVSLLAESKLVRERLEEAGIESPSEPTLRRRESIVVAWVVPATVFDDDDWPGGAAGTTPEARRALRIRAAEAWLKNEGIALVPRATT